MVIYPISTPDADGLSLINWIAEVTVDDAGGWQQDSWFRKVPVADFVAHFDGFRYDWLDVPAMISQADCAYENPMIDRDPVDTWVDGRVGLMGDAAHAMYPTGSNGASQAIVDARELTAMIRTHGAGPAALAAYDAKLCAPVSALVLRNRGAGPFGLLTLLDARCGGVFDDIDDVIPRAEREAFMAGYKAAAGFAMETLNAAPPILPGLAASG
jgi:2-polyprenyl-6-methoxyphenol hydroxylase-like FAD-dependent oxidoreductase